MSVQDESERDIGICLNGGGAAGAFQAGMLLALRSLFNDGRIKAVAGASVGSLNAALAVQGDWNRLRALWTTIRRKDVFNRWGGLLRLCSGGFYSTKPLWRMIQRNIEPDRIKKSDVRLFVQACDRESGVPVVATNDDPELAKMIYASASIPVVFPQVYVKSREAWLVDGGVVDNSPLERLIGLVDTKDQVFCSKIFILHCHPKKNTRRREGMRSRVSMLAHTVRLLYQANQESDRRMVEFHNYVEYKIAPWLRESEKGRRIIELIDVYPERCDVGTLDFNRERILDAIIEGSRVGKIALEGLK